MLFAIGSFIATAQTVAFHETFNQCEGTGGNDGEWSGNIGTGKIVTVPVSSSTVVVLEQL